MKAESKRWVEAVIALDKDMTQKVLCPECQGDFLQFRDLDLKKDDPSEGFDRHMFCGRCGAENYALYLHRVKPGEKE